jgi:hypothetical protein
VIAGSNVLPGRIVRTGWVASEVADAARRAFEAAIRTVSLLARSAAVSVRDAYEVALPEPATLLTVTIARSLPRGAWRKDARPRPPGSPSRPRPSGA